MNTAIFIAFLIGIFTGAIIYWIGLEIGYHRWLKEKSERRLERHIEELEDAAYELARIRRQIDFRVGAENEDK